MLQDNIDRSKKKRSTRITGYSDEDNDVEKFTHLKLYKKMTTPNDMDNTKCTKGDMYLRKISGTKMRKDKVLFMESKKQQSLSGALWCIPQTKFTTMATQRRNLKE